METKPDVIIIGAGVVGCLVAYKLSAYRLHVTVLEESGDVGSGASSANSAILHAGYDPEPGTLKARLNILGSQQWPLLCQKLDIPVKHSGSYVVALSDDEKKSLEILLERGIENGVPRLRIIGRDELRNREPLINPQASGALFAPTAAVIDPFQAVLGPAEQAALNGVRFQFNTRVLGILQLPGEGLEVLTTGGSYRTSYAVNAAGLGSLELMNKDKTENDHNLTPRKGEYLIFDSRAVQCNNVLFPVPGIVGKGTLVSTTTHGNVMIGPSATGCSPDDHSTTRGGLDSILENARRLIPALDPRGIIAQFAGIRATLMPHKDFVIETGGTGDHVVHISGIDSPGLVSAPAIADLAVSYLSQKGLPLENNPSSVMERTPPPRFRELSHREKAELVARDPAYGRIVCRCEEVTEGDVLAAINGPLPARTIDALKRRTWLSTGRCQGTFDHPRVIEILCRETGQDIRAVSKKGRGSELIFRGTKDRGEL